ncbi:exo-alpha-sialidase [Armatimonas rosea]|uniref:exo-alpha-sialidase n=1 Tax=Armatimonas rosea TaxID=685828 RepID=A0A7W9SVD2_ARMRO|nr:exo-alpha-sialidase [Armatimonas rosea]MBB6053063.1 lysophospholipase L1-like esterase [Armatimonas rosea]
MKTEVLWKSGQGGYKSYRIPALAVTKKGTVLAFCEGRRAGAGDSGAIEILLRRSTDNGAHWSEQQVVWADGGNTCGNPAPVVDLQTGTIWLLLTWNRGDDKEPQIIAQTSKDTRRVFVTSSVDDGVTWATPKEITESVKLPEWTWYATGPGAGIQLGKTGRLVVACDHIEAKTKRYFSHVIYSDDHGASWKLGGTTPRDQVNECEVVERSDGSLLLNMRSYDPSSRARQVAVSKDGGLTWGEQRPDFSLIEPICQASVRRADSKTLLFSNPASREARKNLTVRVSSDDGKTWERRLTLHSGPSAYSDLAVLKRNTLACLYECGDKGAYETITLARFALKELTRTPTIFLAGDSTMAEKLPEKRPETGWGEGLRLLVDESKLRIENHAMNGRSTKSFLAEKRWEALIGRVRKGDWVLIQFGHNDQAKDKGERYTPPDDYKANLTRFVAEVRQKGGTPVLLTPVMRRRFDPKGEFFDTHGVYPDLVREVAAATKVLLIDHHRLSEKVLRELGAEPSRKLFLQLKPGENPNYPKGVEDNTHFNAEGAKVMAQLVWEVLSLAVT